MRKRISQKIQTRLKRIKTIQDEIIALNIENMLLCDKYQWYSEETVTKGRGKNKVPYLYGYRNWIEDFTDEDTGEVVSIARKEVIRIDGKWLVSNI